MKTIFPYLVVLLILGSVIDDVKAQPFIHPGILHSQNDLERMKTAVAQHQEPIYSGYQKFIENPASQFTYKMQGPMDTVGRNPTVGQTTYDSDANAAHHNAIMWVITGDKRYAAKAIEIIHAWTNKLKMINGRDAVLMAGLGPFKMINAAEIIRYTNAGWNESDIRKTEVHFKEVVYPVIENFAPFANGNWEAAAMKTAMAIGVFCNDRNIFERAVRYYVDGSGNGCLKNYVINNSGQSQESGRDQAHSQLGIGMLAECCAIAWNQQIDLYGLDDNLLLKGFEYVAKFNLGHDDVPFTTWLDRTGKYYHQKISQQDRGRLRAVYEQIYNHYVVDMQIASPYVQQAAEKLRPEGPGTPGADHPGYGTLYFSGQQIPGYVKPVAPIGLICKGVGSQVQLKWVPSVFAKSCTIKRSISLGGPYTTIASGITGNRYTDSQVSQRTQYYYTVSASNELGESANAFEQSVFTGLPDHWQQADVGHVQPGITLYDGTNLSVESGGTGIDSSSDRFHFSFLPSGKNTWLTVRIVPEPSSQFSKMALVFRRDTTESSPTVALMIFPSKTTQIEAPNWKVKLIQRKTKGANAEVLKEGEGISSPAVTYGRLTGYFWLKLTRKKNVFSGFVSYDGLTWAAAGNCKLKIGDCLAGIAVCSGMQNSTVVSFDNIKVE